MFGIWTCLVLVGIWLHRNLIWRFKPYLPTSKLNSLPIHVLPLIRYMYIQHLYTHSEELPCKLLKVHIQANNCICYNIGAMKPNSVNCFTMRGLLTSLNVRLTKLKDNHTLFYWLERLKKQLWTQCNTGLSPSWEVCEHLIFIWQVRICLIWDHTYGLLPSLYPLSIRLLTSTLAPAWSSSESTCTCICCNITTVHHCCDIIQVF